MDFLFYRKNIFFSLMLFSRTVKKDTKNNKHFKNIIVIKKTDILDYRRMLKVLQITYIKELT